LVGEAEVVLRRDVDFGEAVAGLEGALAEVGVVVRLLQGEALVEVAQLHQLAPEGAADALGGGVPHCKRTREPRANNLFQTRIQASQ